MAGSRIHLIRLSKAKEILELYKGDIPLHHFLHSYFKQNRQMGSTDRKTLSALCYGYFRLGRNAQNIEMEQALAWAGFMQDIPEPAMETWVEAELLPKECLEVKGFDEKIKLLKSAFKEFKTENVFPFQEYLTEQINKEDFAISHLKQAAVWFRCNRKKKEAFVKRLEKENIGFRIYGETAFELLQPTALEKVFGNELATFGEIQDLSSQQTIETIELEPGAKVWDCCAASGGKSLALLDKFPGTELYVSDKRKSILENLKLRFQKAGLAQPPLGEVDLSIPQTKINFGGRQVGPGFFDCILVDAPCTGSGTWTRNPENIAFFKEEEIEVYAQKQREILQAVKPFLKPKGLLVYITCSVFEKENEQQIPFLEGLGFDVVSQQYIKGYDKGADNMWVIGVSHKA